MNVLFLYGSEQGNFDEEEKTNHSGHWRAFYAESTLQAMDIVTNHSIDVIVADIQNPTEDTKFLAKMKHKYPEIGRISLAGNNSFSSGCLAWPIVHQHIEKPYSPNSLRMKIYSVVSSLKSNHN